MPGLRYMAVTSLDGFIEDLSGSFEWAEPDAEVHEFVNELERGVGTHLYGRRMYETMAVWQTYGTAPDSHPAEAAYGEVWRGLDKVVYSRTLTEVWTPRTRLERAVDPEAVRRLKAEATADLSVSGPGLAQTAFEHGLVDQVELVVVPVVVGGGKPGLPHGVRLDLELVDLRRFANGSVYLRYRVA